MDRRNWHFSPRLLRAGCASLALLLALPIASDAGLFGRRRKARPKTAVAAPAQVLGIVVEPLPDGLRLQIDCSSRVRFRTGTLENPHGFYVDLDGAQIADTLRHLSVGTGGVTEIRSEPRGAEQVRISLGLREGVKPRVERAEDGRSLTVRLKNPDPLPAPPPLPEPAQELPRHPGPEPAPTTPAAPTRVTPEARVTGLEIENLSAVEALVRVRLAGRPTSVRPFRVDGPPRLVLELGGVQHSVTGPPRFLGSGPLTIGSVWSAQFSQDPLVTRIVVRLPRASTPFNVEPVDASGELRVRVGSAASATAPPIPATEGPRFRAGLHVGIDPGHGGSDPGALNPAVRISEKEITLDIATRVARLLDQSGVRTSMTRKDDRRLEKTQRIAFVAQGDADVFISIHCDAIEGRPEWTGISTYYHGNRAGGRALAAALQSVLPDATGLPDRGIRSDFSRFPREGFYVLRNARMPAVLIECGYVSHAPTARKMSQPEFRQQVAQGIVEGLRKYWEDRGARSMASNE